MAAGCSCQQREQIENHARGDRRGLMRDRRIGLSARKKYYAYDFWNNRFVGCVKGSGVLRASLRAEEALIFSVREVVDHPQVLSTNRHIMQGMMELHEVRWDEAGKTLSGWADVVGGEPFALTFAANGHSVKAVKTDSGACELGGRQRAEDLADLVIQADKNARVRFTIEFE